jgi:hypothetical protein
MNILFYKISEPVRIFFGSDRAAPPCTGREWCIQIAQAQDGSRQVMNRRKTDRDGSQVGIRHIREGQCEKFQIRFLLGLNFKQIRITHECHTV